MSDELSTVTIGHCVPGDEHEIVRVFNKVFKQQRTVEAWRWQYAENPEGLHCFLAKLPDGRVLSQFTGIPRRMKIRDGTACFGEIVDSLTDPDYRQGLKKPGLFATTCYHFVDHFGRPEAEVVMYGLPNRPAYRVGRALLGYVHLYDIEFMTRALDDAGDSVAPADLEIREITSFSPDTDDLQARLEEHHEVMAVRDRRYLEWRFARRPDIRYEMLEFRSGEGRLFGLAVLRHHWLDKPLTACAELFFERSHPYLRDAMNEVCRRARAAGSERIQALFRPDSFEWLGLADLGFQPEPSQFRLVARTYDHERIPLDWLKGVWYLTLGDFDIV